MSAPKRTEVENVEASAAQRQFISTRERSRQVRITKALVIPVGAFIIWATITNLSLVEPIFLPTPQKIVRVFWAIREVIPGAFWITIRMVAAGLLLGGITGLGTGLAFGYSKWARDLLEFSLDALRPVPLFALIPLFVLWLGIGMTPQIALVTLGVFLILTIQTTEAVRNVPHIYVRAALTAGASRFHIYRTVVVPAIVPHILAGLRLAVVGAWGLDVAAEFMGSQAGLGYLMLTRMRFLDTAGIMAIVLIFAVLAVGSDFLLRAFINRTTVWMQRSQDVGVVADILGTT